jgi:hypothetical protein
VSSDEGRSIRARRGRVHLRLAARPPVRRTDRLEDLVAWLMMSLGLLALLGAVVVGRAAHTAALGPDGVGAAAPIRAELLADAPPESGGPAPTPWVPVAWTAADGTEETGEIAVRGPMRAGTTVAAWVDRHGRVTTTPPRHTSEAVAFGVGAGLTTAALAWALLGLTWTSLCRVTASRNDAAWAREWATVEPVWSGRER